MSHLFVLFEVKQVGCVFLQCVFVKYTKCVFVTSSLEICFLQCVFVKYTKCEFVTSSLEISKLLQLDVSSLGLC